MIATQTAPATTPQNADPIPSSDSPLSVTRNVTSAGSRQRRSAIAVASPPPIVPSSAKPATASTSAFGNAPISPATAPAASPTHR